MEDLSVRINQALVREEALAERFANNVRLMLYTILSIVVLLNTATVSVSASAMNLGVLAAGFTFGIFIYIRMKRDAYYPAMKYVTSFLDIFLVYVLSFLYTFIEVPAVALKSYVFLINFPLILLTTFRFDKRLTLFTGIWAVVLYLATFLFFYTKGSITIHNGGYFSELFSAEITIVGQSTKMLILCGFTALATYLAHYSRNVIKKTITNEISRQIENESMMHELEIASQVQQQLLPRSIPAFQDLDIYGTVLQGKFVGGDYFDFLRLSDNVLRVVIADVSGKGVPAALIMSEVRGSTHLLSSMGLSLEEFIRQLNIMVRNSTANHVFVTYFIADINTTDGTLHYINAGHPRAYIHSSGDVIPLSKRTFALGALDVLPQLGSESLPFPSGSLLVAYTDGVFEYSNAGQEQYGEERINAYVINAKSGNAVDMVNGLLSDVKAFGGMKPFDDDAALLIVKSINRSL